MARIDRVCDEMNNSTVSGNNKSFHWFVMVNIQSFMMVLFSCESRAAATLSTLSV